MIDVACNDALQTWKGTDETKLYAYGPENGQKPCPPSALSKPLIRRLCGREAAMPGL